MAVLAVFLVAVLFIGAAAAATDKTVSADAANPTEITKSGDYSLNYSNATISGHYSKPGFTSFTTETFEEIGGTKELVLAGGSVTLSKANNGAYSYTKTASGKVTYRVNYTDAADATGNFVEIDPEVLYVRNVSANVPANLMYPDGSYAEAGTPFVNVTTKVPVYVSGVDGYITGQPLGTSLEYNLTLSDVTYYLTVNIGGIDPVTGYYRDVFSTNDTFVYEKINVTSLLGSKVNTLVMYSSGANPTVINQIAGVDGEFYLTEAAVGSNYGKYYINGKLDESEGVIYIWYPEISLAAELADENGATSGDSIDGKTINKDTRVAFLVNSPKLAPTFFDGEANLAAKAKIVFTTPVAGKTTDFGAAHFNSVALNGVQTKAGITTPTEAATAGTYTAQAEYTKFDLADGTEYSVFADYAKKSNTISFTVQSSTLTITAAKDSVVRSNPFTVTISGKSKVTYGVYIESPATNEVNPTLQEAQSGFQKNADYGNVATNYNVEDGYIYYDGYAPAIGGIFETDASGKRTIQFNTAKDTEDKTYTIKVSGLIENPLTSSLTGNLIFDTAEYDKVKVKVEKGAVTITASGDGSYYIGDEIKLTGTNTDSTLVFLFITGQNLLENGVQVKALPIKAAAKDNGQPVAVKTDNTWEYKWDTAGIALDTGAYTIYATSRLTNGKSSEKAESTSQYSDGYADSLKVPPVGTAVKLSDSEYATVSINLKQPFLSAVPSGTIVAKGDKIYVRGTAEGDPSTLKLFIFGPNFFQDYSITVEDDGSYEKKIEIPSTMSSNQYFVVVQHPMYNNVFDAYLWDTDGGTQPFDRESTHQWAFSTDGTTTGGDQQSFIVWGSTNKLQGSQAADALTKMIDSANIDDIYTKLTFTVAEPWIKITNPGDKATGSKFTITGTTNLAIDDQILVEVMSSSFSAVDKTSTATTSGVSQATKVVAGEGTDNTWSVEVDTTNWKLDEYTIKVNGIEVDVTTTTNFNLVEKVVTTVPTTSATTAVPTGATSVPTTTPTKTPGFGAFIALAGLGAVALLVLRRN